MSYDEWRSRVTAMGRRNRAELEKARAKGARTWICEEFRRGEDDVMSVATKRVSVVRDDEGDFKEKLIADDGSTYYDAEAIAAMNQAWETGAFQGLHRDLGQGPQAPPPPQIRTRAHAVSERPRRTQPRARQRRETGGRSSSRGGDSGSEDGESEPPPRRLCGFCGGDIPADRGPKAKHCNDKHAANSRQRRKRQRDRERDVRPPILTDERRMYEFDAGELVRLLRDATCACNGGHIPDDDELLGQRCTKCGRQRPSSWCGRRLLEQLTFRLAERKGATL